MGAIRRDLRVDLGPGRVEAAAGHLEHLPCQGDVLSQRVDRGGRARSLEAGGDLGQGRVGGGIAGDGLDGGGLRGSCRVSIDICGRECSDAGRHGPIR